VIHRKKLLDQVLFSYNKEKIYERDAALAIYKTGLE